VWNRQTRCAACGEKLRPEDRVALAAQPLRRASLAEVGKLPADAITWHEECFAQATGEDAVAP
jgi:hypothetical protein